MSTILLIEDDASLRDLLADALRDEGHTVLVTSSAHEALARAADARIDLVITDVVWGREPTATVDGLAVLRAATAAPILLCTGDARLIDLTPTRAGIIAVVPKPFDLFALLESVDAILSSKGKGFAGPRQ